VRIGLPDKEYDTVFTHCISIPTIFALSSFLLQFLSSGYDTRSYFCVRSNADIKSQLNLPYGTKVKTGKEKN